MNKNKLKPIGWGLATAAGIASNLGTVNFKEFRQFLGPVLGEYSGDFWIGLGIASAGGATMIMANLLHLEKGVSQKLILGIMGVGLLALFANETLGFGGGTPILLDTIAGLTGLVISAKFYDEAVKYALSSR